jgi:hypothetical protein
MAERAGCRSPAQAKGARHRQNVVVGVNLVSPGIGPPCPSLSLLVPHCRAVCRQSIPRANRRPAGPGSRGRTPVKSRPVSSGVEWRAPSPGGGRVAAPGPRLERPSRSARPPSSRPSNHPRAPSRRITRRSEPSNQPPLRAIESPASPRAPASLHFTFSPRWLNMLMERQNGRRPSGLTGLRRRPGQAPMEGVPGGLPGPVASSRSTRPGGSASGTILSGDTAISGSATPSGAGPNTSQRQGRGRSGRSASAPRPAGSGAGSSAGTRRRGRT